MTVKRRSKNSLQLSVVIVNYNVREFLDHALTALKKAMKGIRGEIIVVDNASDDGSVEMVRRRYSSVTLIANKSNLGFSKANNLALQQARGSHLLLLNPDTVVQEDTLRVMLKFFDDHPDVGLAGCKILNPDGTFQLACRRSFPRPWVAFTKIFGLSTLFPRTKLFGRYNLTYLDPEETYEVDAVSGSFMFVRRTVLEKVGGLDEAFFMYGEDLDWCYRIQQAGWKIYYVPLTQIIHYKGESTKRSSIDDITMFYEAMDLFVRKHFNRSFLLSLTLRVGIVFSSGMARVGEFLRPLWIALVDILLVDAGLVAAEWIWRGAIFTFPLHSYLVIDTVPALMVVGSLYAAGVYTHRRMSISRTMSAVLLSSIFLSAAVAFFKEYAFSRAVIILSGIFSFILLPAWRLVVRMTKQPAGGGRRLFGRRTLIVGTDRAGQEILRRIRGRVSDGYEIVGFIDKTRKRIGETVAGLPIVGSNDTVGRVIEQERISDVIFSTQTLSYTDILSVISRAAGKAVNFHIVPNTLDVIIGKASVDSLDVLPLVPISYNIEKPFNQAMKRLFDIVVASVLLLSVYPFIYLGHAVRSSFRSRFILTLPTVLAGRLSLVGPSIAYSPIIPSNGRSAGSIFLGKPGLTGLVQLQGKGALTPEEVEQFNLHYARNQSLLMDVEILLKTLFRSRADGHGESRLDSPAPGGVAKHQEKHGAREKMKGIV
jgi:hypothetical protein